MATSTNDPNASNKSWELSLYELNRQPQPVITDCTEIAVSPRSLHSELMCPICLDMLKTTMTTKECLHRFCQDCIITALRSGNKECPTCRKKLVSKRSLRPDPNFDALISKIYPSREDYDAQQERVMAKVSKHNFSANIEETLKMQAMNRSRHGKKVAGEASEEATTSAAAAAAAASASASASATSTASASRHPSTSSSRNGGEGNSAAATGDPLSEEEGEEEEDEDEDDNDSGWGEEQADSSGLESAGPQANDVELVVKPLPHGERTNPYLKTVRYIKTTVTATVDHISKYLEMRYTMENRDSGGASSNGSSSASASASSEQELSGASLDGSTGGAALPSTSTTSSSSSSSGDIQTAAAAVASTSSSSAGSAPETGSDYGSASSSAGLEATSSTSCSATTKKYPFAIFIAAGPGQFHPLSGDWSLTAVVDKYWKVNRPLELFYAYKVASLTAKQAADHPVGASARW